LFVLRSRLLAAVVISMVVLTTAALQAGASDQYGGPQWPNIMDDEARQTPIAAEDLVFPVLPATPAFLDADPEFTGAINSDTIGSTARWPTFPPEHTPSPFEFETGVRYWYSTGSMRFGFFNGSPLYGDPTSTLDWTDLTGQSGEVFARLDHKPSGLFVKGMAGLGMITDGGIDDRDYFATQFKFSDTTSVVKDGNLSFLSLDVGWAYAPAPGYRFSFFVGYQFWREKATAYGVYCNQATIVFTGCPSAGALVVGYDTAVFVYEPTWHAVRIGVEGRAAITDRWSVQGEIVGIPFALLENLDSHLLRQSPADLGPAPNVISNGRAGLGVQAEVLINYALNENFEIGGGVRYWQIVASEGGVHAGPTFASNDALRTFDQNRFGLLLQAKGKF
jgi:hypothetical protein